VQKRKKGVLFLFAPAPLSATAPAPALLLLSAAGLLLQSAGGFLFLSAAASRVSTAAFEDSMLADAAGVTLTADGCTVEVIASLPLGLADFLPLRTVLA
jgi:hypothetical protein